MTGAEVRYERLRPAELQARVASAPLAWLPLGPLEFHGPHLPLGVDGLQAHAMATAAARSGGGVVLPVSYVGSSTLDLPWTLGCGPALVEAVVMETAAQLARRGFEALMVLTGHCPLDLIHLLKRVCRQAQATYEIRVYGLGWLELHVDGLAGVETGEPTVVDHAGPVETSQMLAAHPELVALDRLSADPEATHTGVYGRNPRAAASRARGEALMQGASAGLAALGRSVLDGAPPDPEAALRRFVRLCWPEPLELSIPLGGQPLQLRNPGRASRYLSRVALRVDGQPVDASAVELRNDSAGEAREPRTAASLGLETGFYLRRGQLATVTIPAPLAANAEQLEIELGLGGVSTVRARMDLRLRSRTVQVVGTAPA